MERIQGITPRKPTLNELNGRFVQRFLIFLFVPIVVMSSCLVTHPLSTLSPRQIKSVQTSELPSNLLYVVAIEKENSDSKNELVVLNADTFEEINRTSLMDNTLFFKFSQDPLGRIWIGYGGTLENKTKRVDVFHNDGSHLKSMDLCTWPNVRISFAANQAFVPCYLNGFQAKLAVIELESLALTKMGSTGSDVVDKVRRTVQK